MTLRMKMSKEPLDIKTLKMRSFKTVALDGGWKTLPGVMLLTLEADPTPRDCSDCVRHEEGEAI